MDSKEIIIDGVDVSGCEYTCNTAFGKNGCKHPMMKNILCFKNPNCYYKQLQKEKFENLSNKQMVESAENLIYENSELYKNLKEKEQECEELREALKEEVIYKRTYLKSFLDCKEECEELKAQLETYSKMLENPEFKIALTDVRTGERKVWRKLGSKAQRYEQALEEIEEIVSGNYETLDPLAKQQINSIITKAWGGG